MRWLDLSPLHIRLVVAEDLFGAPYLAAQTTRSVTGQRPILTRAGFKQSAHGHYSLQLLRFDAASVEPVLEYLAAAAGEKARWEEFHPADVLQSIYDRSLKDGFDDSAALLVADFTKTFRDLKDEDHPDFGSLEPGRDDVGSGRPQDLQSAPAEVAPRSEDGDGPDVPAQSQGGGTQTGTGPDPVVEGDQGPELDLNLDQRAQNAGARERVQSPEGNSRLGILNRASRVSADDLQDVLDEVPDLDVTSLEAVIAEDPVVLDAVESINQPASEALGDSDPANAPETEPPVTDLIPGETRDESQDAPAESVPAELQRDDSTDFEPQLETAREISPPVPLHEPSEALQEAPADPALSVQEVVAGDPAEIAPDAPSPVVGDALAVDVQDEVPTARQDTVEETEAEALAADASLDDAAESAPEVAEDSSQAEELDPVEARRIAREKTLEDRRRLNEHRPIADVAEVRAPLAPEARREHDVAALRNLAALAASSVSDAHMGLSAEQQSLVVQFTGSLAGGRVDARNLEHLGAFPSVYLKLARSWALDSIEEPSEEELASYGETALQAVTPADKQALLYRLELNTTSTVTDHFAQGLWTLAERMGFAGGKVLLPNSGFGTLSRMRPDDPAIRVTQVPNEPFAAAIAERTYPEDAVIGGRLSSVVLPGNYYDLAIAVANVHPDIVSARGLPPFARDESINIEPDTPPLTEAEHLIYKGIKSVRPGGLTIVAVPSECLSDHSSRGQAAHSRLARNGEILLAQKLSSFAVTGPQKDSLVGNVLGNRDAFNAGEIAFSLLVLRTREAVITEEEAADHWNEATRELNDLVPSLTSSDAFRLAQAELQRDGVFEGTERFIDTTYRASVGQVFAAILERAPEAALIPSERINPDALGVLRRPGALINEERAEANGVYVLDDNGGVRFRLNGVLNEVAFTGDAVQRIRLLIPIRDLVREALDHQQTSNDDDKLAEIQGRLTRAYDAFTARFGPVLLPANRSVFERDTFAPSLNQLEHFDEELGIADKTVFFTDRVLRRNTLIERADSPDEALSLSMGRLGYVSAPLISTLLQEPWDQVREKLGDKVFRDPMHGRWVTQSQYVSGPVRAKLRTAQAAALIDPEVFSDNIPALQASLPKLAQPEEIGFMMGAPWIPIEDYRRFISDRLGVGAEHRKTAVQIKYDRLAARYTVSIDYDQCDVARVRDYTSDEILPRDIFEANLNGRSIRAVMDNPNHVPTGAENEKIPQIADHAATAQVHIYQERIRDEFVGWCTENPVRANRLATIYNEKVNAFRDRVVDGSYLTFEMCSPRWVPRSHQKDAVARFIEDGNMLAAHGLGTGKTFTQAACCIESVRMGLHSKPMMVTPKNTFAQTAAEIIQAYPTAKVLMAETLSPQNKAGIREFVARAAMDQWDLILMTYDSFKAVSLSASAQMKVFQRKYAESLKEAVREIDPAAALTRRQSSLMKWMRELDTKVIAQRRNGDDQWGFEAIGVDLLVVDEAQNFKNINVSTKMNVLGISTTGSDRARDLDSKIDHVRHFNGNNRGVVMATATPISNSIAEIYTMMNYVNPMVLRSMGIRHFDAWAATFGRVQSLIEQKPAGDGFQIRDRFIRFQNVPEMVRSFRMVADLRLDDDQVDSKVTRPKLTTTLISSPKSPLDEALLKSMEVRARALEVRPKLWSKDSVIVIMGDLRRSMLDPRLVDPRLPSHGTEVIIQAADKLAAVFEETTAIRGTQFVFLDQGVYAKPFSLYEELREQLMARGIPRNQIALINEYSKTNERHRLIQRFNDGRIRILVGSSTKIGVGMNAQRRCVAMHQIDIPFRPDLLMQRLGRGWRPGNENPEVHNFVYGKTGQTRQFEIIYNKAMAINQAFRDPDKASRNLDEELDVSLENIQIELTENNLLREKVQLDNELKTLQLQKSAHQKTVAGYRLDAMNQAQLLASITDRQPQYDAAAAQIGELFEQSRLRKIQDQADLEAAREVKEKAYGVLHEASAALKAFKDLIIAQKDERIQADAAEALAAHPGSDEKDPEPVPTDLGPAPVLPDQAQGETRPLWEMTGNERRAALAKAKREYSKEIDAIFSAKSKSATSETPNGVDETAVDLTPEQEQTLDRLVSDLTAAQKVYNEARERYAEIDSWSLGLLMEVEGHIVRRGAAAGHAIFQRLDNLRQSELRDGRYRVGSIGNIELSISPPIGQGLFSSLTEGRLFVSNDNKALGIEFRDDELYRGTMHMSCEGVSVTIGLGVNGQSNVIRMINALHKAYESIGSIQERVARLAESIADLQRRADTPFPREADLADLQRRKLELDTELLTQQGRVTPEQEAQIMLPVLDAVHHKTGRPVHPERLVQWEDRDVGLDIAAPEGEAEQAEAGDMAREILGLDRPAGNEPPVPPGQIMAL